MSPEDLPLDAVELASALGLDGPLAARGARTASGKVDTAIRGEVGLAGELALMSLLEAQWPGAAAHIAAEHDGFGYDIALALDGITWHLEVKSTTRRGSLVLFLSRNEFEVNLADDRWQLTAVGVGSDGEIDCLATVKKQLVHTAAPHDVTGARWEVARYQPGPPDLCPGLAFLQAARLAETHGPLATGIGSPGQQYEWIRLSLKRCRRRRVCWDRSQARHRAGSGAPSDDPVRFDGKPAGSSLHPARAAVGLSSVAVLIAVRVVRAPLGVCLAAGRLQGADLRGEERSRTPAALTRSLSRGSRNIGAGLPRLRDFRGGSRIRRLSAWPVLLMPPPLSERLPEDHLVWTVVGAVGQMDLGRFAEARIGWVGRVVLRMARR